MIQFHSILSGLDKRTTLMIRNIPNKYSIQLINDEIKARFANKYDVLYLPIDKNSQCNLGYAFINFICPIHIIDFYNFFQGRTWLRFSSSKKCALVYGKIQGKSNIIIHFEKGIQHQNLSKDHPPLDINSKLPRPKAILPLDLKDLFIQYYPSF